MTRQTIVFRPGMAPEPDPSSEQIAAACASRDQLLWIDLLAPSTADIDAIAQEFEFHPLAREDAHHRRQRPKVDQYGDALFIVFYALSVEDLQVTQEEIHVYIGPNVVITMSDHPIPAVLDIRQRWLEAGPAGNGGQTAGMLLYALLDAIVDDYFPVVDHLSELLDAAQERIFEAQDTGNQQHVYRIVRTLLLVRRVLAPERDVLNALVRRDIPIIEASTIVYFQDVYDHILRMAETIDTYRELVAGAIDVQLAVTSNRLNEVMKRMTALSIILMSVTLIASIYGMNFVNMPELDWHYGYPIAITTMVAIGAVLFVIFRRIKYL